MLLKGDLFLREGGTLHHSEYGEETAGAEDANVREGLTGGQVMCT